MRSFTVREFHDFIKILEERPEWREELRRLVLTDELLKLPEIVRELVEAQRRTEEELRSLTARMDALTERVDALTERMDALAEAQRRTEEELRSLTARVDALTERVDALTERVDTLAEAQRRTEEELRSLAARVDVLAESQRKMEIDLSDLKGDSLERRYREKAFAYFGQLVRRVHVLSPDEMARLIDQGVEKGIISDEEADELSWVDAIVRGRRKEDGEEVYLVVEVSWGIGVGDVERAAERAEMLRKFGFNVLPVVAGKMIMDDADMVAREMRVFRVVDGHVMD
jgi:polyhydroxyalkanoate synthesis regulator phasin